MSSISSLCEKLSLALKDSELDGPYPRFILDDVLHESEYLSLLKDFPDYLVSNPGNDRFDSYNIRPAAELPLGLSTDWQNLLQSLRSPTMLASLVEVCSEHTARRYPVIWRWLLIPRIRNPKKYEVNIAISSSYEGRYLAPHSDNSYKVLALVMYFAVPGVTSSLEGTRFYSSKSKGVLRQAVRRFNRLSDSIITRSLPLWLLPMTSSHIHNGTKSPEEQRSNEEWFYENFENDFNVIYHQNRIAGFIKTHGSFHEVDMRESTSEGPRRSLLINLNLKHSLAARIGQKFRARVLRLST
jgi:hypothetical protein